MSQPQSDSRPTVDPSGLGVGFGIAVFGMLLLLVPLLLRLNEVGFTLVLIASVLVTTVGVAGILLEVGKHRSRPWLADISTGFILIGLASAVLLIHVRSTFPEWVHVLLVLLLVALVGIAVIGMSMGLAKASHSRAASSKPGGAVTSAAKSDAVPVERLRRNDRFNIGVAIGCTLVQCAVSIGIAVLASAK